MIADLLRLSATLAGLAIVLWHSGLIAHRHGFGPGRKVFYLKFSALTKIPNNRK